VEESIVCADYCVIHVSSTSPAALESEDKTTVMWEAHQALPVLSWPTVTQEQQHRSRNGNRGRAAN